MKNTGFRVARYFFRLTNSVIGRWGILLSKPGILHGSPAYAGATTWARRLHQMNFFYQKIKEVRGDIVESGVHWGYGMLIHATISEIIGGIERTIYGFDSFAGHSAPTKADLAGGDYKPLDNAFAISKEDVWKTLVLGTGHAEADLKKNIELVPGWIQESMPAFYRRHENMGTKIALVHADCDIYEPFLSTLKNTWPLLQPGGIIILGRLNNSELMGKTRAVEEFLTEIALDQYRLEKIYSTDTDEIEVDVSYLVKTE